MAAEVGGGVRESGEDGVSPRCSSSVNFVFSSNR